MNLRLPSSFVVHPDVVFGLKNGHPIVALESAVITHGLPHPQNLQLAQSLEQVVRAQAAIPATIALLQGIVHIGLSSEELNQIANEQKTRKISRRDFGIAIARQESGGTTVAGTLIAAHLAGIQVFATGGIGGVHRQSNFDISADLPELGRTPLVVVCAGAKAILDLPATLEYLETCGVPVIGYQTDEFPAFFSITSGLKTTARADSPEEIAEIARSQWALGMQNAILVTAPPPAESALPREVIEAVIQNAIEQAEKQHISGAALTPFLLQKVNQLSQGKSLSANLALLENNARLAAKIAVCLAQGKSARI